MVCLSSIIGGVFFVNLDKCSGLYLFISSDEGSYELKHFFIAIRSLRILLLYHYPSLCFSSFMVRGPVRKVLDWLYEQFVCIVDAHALQNMGYTAAGVKTGYKWLVEFNL